MAFLRQKPLLGIFFIVFIVGLAWALYTQHAWEDYYITYRASKNLATGHGLTFTSGERVHSFTSPLGVLLPAFSSLLTLNRSDETALWIFRIMSLAAYAGAAVFLWKLARATHRTAWAAWLLAGTFAIDTKIVDFTTNGMETGFLMLFLSWTLYATLAAPPRPSLQIGIAWAGLMWSRPDSILYIGAIAFGALLFEPPLAMTRGRWGLFRTFLAAGVITTLLYLPWVGWAWSYYGTPVPHTITAKGLFHTTLTPAALWNLVWNFPQVIAAHTEIPAATFMPPYSTSIAGWPLTVIKISYWLTLGCMAVWMIPGIRRETRLASFAFCIGEFYLCSFVSFPVPWYIPTLTVFALIVAAGLVGQFVDFIRARPPASPRLPFWQNSGGAAAWVVSAFLVLGPLTITVLAAQQLRTQQALIERGERQVIGLWLRDHAASPRDTVFLECLGYIGFYSNLKMYDYPGMSSPEMVAARKRAHGRDYPNCWHELILDLSPKWLVLRAFEVAAIRRNNPGLLTKRYSLARIFDVTKQVNALPFIMGRGYLLFDSYFEVYRRNDAAIETGSALGSSVQIPSKDTLRN